MSAPVSSSFGVPADAATGGRLARLLERLRYESVASNLGYVARRAASPAAQLDLWRICRCDLSRPLAPVRARIAIEVRQASDDELEPAACLDGAGEQEATLLRSWVRAGNACFVARVEGEVVGRGALITRTMAFSDYCIAPGPGEVYLTGGYTAKAWRGRRIHLELEYRLLAAQAAGARTAYVLASVDNTRSLRNSLRAGYRPSGLMLCARRRRTERVRLWRLSGSLDPIRPLGSAVMTDLLAGNDVFAFADCLLVIPRAAPRLYLLNPTARLVWQDLAAGRTPDEAAVGLAARFAIPPARVQADVAAILAEWRGHGLLDGAPLAAKVAPPADRAPGAGAAARPCHADRVYRICGHPVRLRLEDPAIDQAVHPPLAHSVDPAGEAADVVEVVRDRRGFLVVCNGSDVERAAKLEEALGQVFGRILELSHPEADWLAMVHAAAVGDARGALVLAGDTGSGKSTLTAALVHAGLAYFSDDVVPLDASLRIRPMPFGISVKEGSWPVLAERYPELAGLPVHEGRRRRYLPIAASRTAPGAGLPVKSIVFPTYRPEQSTVLRALTPLEVLEQLTRSHSWISLDGRRFAGTLRWIEQTPGFELHHASLDEAVRLVRDLLDDEDGGSRPHRPDNGRTSDGRWPAARRD